MSNVQKAIVPAILFCSFLLALLNHLVQPQTTASADNALTQPEIVYNETETDTETPEICALHESYPVKVVQWCSLIEREAGNYGVDPLLVAAVMLVESGGQPEVISHSGAVGLMQVMPRDGIASTFQCINGPCFANRPTIEELKNPDFNVEYGVGMIAGLINRHGSIRDALKSYGPGDVGYWYADKVLGIYAALSGNG